VNRSESQLDSTPGQKGAEENQFPVRSSLNTTAHALRVNRTHRVVRERAKSMQARRMKARSLWIPMMVCASLIVIFCSAVWVVLDEYELVPTGVPDSSNQMFVLLLWFLPVSASLLAMVWFRRHRNRSSEELAQ